MDFDYSGDGNGARYAFWSSKTLNYPTVLSRMFAYASVNNIRPNFCDYCCLQCARIIVCAAFNNNYDYENKQIFRCSKTDRGLVPRDELRPKGSRTPY